MPSEIGASRPLPPTPTSRSAPSSAELTLKLAQSLGDLMPPGEKAQAEVVAVRDTQVSFQLLLRHVACRAVLHHGERGGRRSVGCRAGLGPQGDVGGALPGAALGGYSGVWAARRVPQAIIRALVVAVGLLLAAYYFFTS